jgi:hypothetical protein
MPQRACSRGSSAPDDERRLSSRSGDHRERCLRTQAATGQRWHHSTPHGTHAQDSLPTSRVRPRRRAEDDRGCVAGTVARSAAQPPRIAPDRAESAGWVTSRRQTSSPLSCVIAALRAERSSRFTRERSQVRNPPRPSSEGAAMEVGRARNDPIAATSGGARLAQSSADCGHEAIPCAAGVPRRGSTSSEGSNPSQR